MLALLLVLPLLASANPIVKRATNQLVYAGRDNLCISVQGGSKAVAKNQVGDGTAVVSIPCSQASTWDISPGSGSLVLSGTNFALDAGSNPGNNGALKVWTSYPGLYQQTWFYTGDQRIAITGGTQCLDEGDQGNKIQTYECTTGNTNQIFYNKNPSGPSSSSSSSSSSSTSHSSSSSSSSSTSHSSSSSASHSASASSSSSGPQPTGVLPNIPAGKVYKDPTNKGKRIHPNGRSDLCVTVQNGYAGIGSAVELSYCFANNDQFVKNQLWDYTVGQTGLIKLHGQNLCLDAGDNPGNAASLKVWTCYDGLLQQTWNFQTANVLSLPNSGCGDQCLDVVSGSQPGTQKPYNSVGDLQTWECSTNNDPQQIFYQLK